MAITYDSVPLYHTQDTIDEKPFGLKKSLGTRLYLVSWVWLLFVCFWEVENFLFCNFYYQLHVGEVKGFA